MLFKITHLEFEENRILFHVFTFTYKMIFSVLGIIKIKITMKIAESNFWH